MRVNWLESNTWPVASWCMFMEPVRTNNDVEGWHRRLNVRVGQADVSFYILVHKLHEEARSVALQVKLVSQGKLK